MFMNLQQAKAIAEIRHDPPSPWFSNWELLAISIGIRDGEIALARSRFLSFLAFFANARPVPLANDGLEALRAYTELARALFPRSIPSTVLSKAGFSAAQIRGVLQMVRARVGQL